jgi:hypothetical protein
MVAEHGGGCVLSFFIKVGMKVPVSLLQKKVVNESVKLKLYKHFTISR